MTAASHFLPLKAARPARRLLTCLAGLLGLALGAPDIVLRKVYYGKALRLVHGLPAGGFPPVPAGGGGD